MKAFTRTCLIVALNLVLIEVSSFSALSNQSPINVVVTGAGSSVGYLVFKKLLENKKFCPIALVRDKKSVERLKKLGAEPTQIFKGDVTNKDTLKGLFNGVNKVILCTSSRAKKRLRFRVRSLFARLFRKQKPIPSGRDMFYPKGQQPYLVDYIGQRNIIDAAIQNNVEHIVMLGNMGGYRGSKVNEIGRDTRGDDPKKGNILLWKRAAERYLMKRSFFTIVHAGALTDEKGGEREIVWDTDDALLRTSFRKIPREDVAEVLVQALVWREAVGRSIDVASLPPGQGSGPTKNWLRFWARPGNCLYPLEKDDVVGPEE